MLHRLFAIVAVLTAVDGIAPLFGAELQVADRLYFEGKYVEAEAAYKKLADDPAAVVGRARSLAARGKIADAEALLKAALANLPGNAAIPAELAIICFNRGDYRQAAKHADAAIARTREQPAARWVKAELHRVAGRLDEANDGYRWFVDFYNHSDERLDAEMLLYVCRASAEYARWNRLTDQFHVLVNDIYPQILKRNPHCWPAHLDAGLLFLEKFNGADASVELHKAAAINPHAAEVQAALAMLALQTYDLAEAQQHVDRALKTNPRSLAAYKMQAAVHLANYEPSLAVDVLQRALKLNPLDEQTLGMLAAAYVGRDGMGAGVSDADLAGVQESEFAASPQGKIVGEVASRNRHAGRFYEAAGDALELQRKYPDAARFYRLAIEKMPQLVGPRGKLGLIQMRLGDEAEAAKLLDESFEIDPFNVRVSNTLKVLEVLAGYTTLETEHFQIRFDRTHDEILAQHAAQYLEEIYPELCNQLGYEPAGKTLIEIFSRAKNTDGHGWFSARMVGLPFIGTVGACAGRMVAIQSPNDARQKFNWARVLRHEFVHVVNLQQTDFNIPHWFTEALAVYLEGTSRPSAWNEALAARASADSLFNLDTINSGFIRPQTSQDWTLAYCQAELYAEYMLKRFGSDAHGTLLAAYADRLPTRKAIERSFGIDQADFERGYSDYVRRIAAALPTRETDGPDDLPKLVASHEAKPDDADVAARLAMRLLSQGDVVRARQLADRAVEVQPKHPLAGYVLARLKLRSGETDGAVGILQACLDCENPHRRSLALLAGLKLKAGQFDEAAELFSLGACRFAGDPQWLKSLAQVYLLSDEDEKLYDVLEKLATFDFDDALVRSKLAWLAIDRKDFPAAERWTRELLQIDVTDADAHRILAESLMRQQRPSEAATAYEYAVRISPGNIELRIALAEACIAARKTARAREILAAVLDRQPDHPVAAKFMQSLDSSGQ